MPTHSYLETFINVSAVSRVVYVWRKQCNNRFSGTFVIVSRSFRMPFLKDFTRFPAFSSRNRLNGRINVYVTIFYEINKNSSDKTLTNPTGHFEESAVKQYSTESNLKDNYTFMFYIYRKFSSVFAFLLLFVLTFIFYWHTWGLLSLLVVINYMSISSLLLDFEYRFVWHRVLREVIKPLLNPLYIHLLTLKYNFVTAASTVEFFYEIIILIISNNNSVVRYYLFSTYNKMYKISPNIRYNYHIIHK